MNHLTDPPGTTTRATGSAPAGVGRAVPGRPGWIFVERLGAGGFAEVWRVENRASGESQALKIFPTTAEVEPGLIRRELDNCAALQDRLPADAPVVRPIAVDREALWIAMPLMAGGTLHDRLRSLGRPMSPDEVAPIARRIAQALASAHDAGIVHRDVKPTNILFDAEGQAFLSDFGLASTGPAPADDSAEPDILLSGLPTRLDGAGTTAYMSPEQRSGAEPDPSDDTYAFGVLVWQMLTGQPTEEPPRWAMRDLRSALETDGRLVFDSTRWQTLVSRCIEQPRSGTRPADGSELLTLTPRARVGAETPDDTPADLAELSQEAELLKGPRWTIGLRLIWSLPAISCAAGVLLIQDHHRLSEAVPWLFVVPFVGVALWTAYLYSQPPRRERWRADADGILINNTRLAWDDIRVIRSTDRRHYTFGSGSDRFAIRIRSANGVTLERGISRRNHLSSWKQLFDVIHRHAAAHQIDADHNVMAVSNRLRKRWRQWAKDREAREQARKYRGFMGW